MAAISELEETTVAPDFSQKEDDVERATSPAEQGGGGAAAASDKAAGGGDKDEGRVDMKRIRAYQAGMIVTGILTGFFSTVCARLSLGTGSTVFQGVAAALVIGAPFPYIAAKPWMIAFPTLTPQATKINMMAIVATTLLTAVISLLPRLFDGTARRVTWICFACWLHAVLFGLLAVRYRKRYGGLRMLFNSCFGVLNMTHEFLNLLLLLQLDHELGPMVRTLITVCVVFLLCFGLAPYVIGLHPNVACSRRRFGMGIEDTPAKIELEPGYLFLLSLESLYIPIATGGIVARLYLLPGAATLLVATLFQAFMVLVTKFFNALAKGAVPESEAVPFTFIALLVADSFLNLVFMNASVEDFTFWATLAVEFCFIIMRDADLWGDLRKLICRTRRMSSQGEALVELIRVPEQLASVSVASEFVSTVTLLVVVSCELLMSGGGVGDPALTAGMTQSDRLGTLGVLGIVFAMQLLALGITHLINARKKKALLKGSDDDDGVTLENARRSVIQMWEAHGLYFVVSTAYVVGCMILNGVNMKLLMADKEMLPL